MKDQPGDRQVARQLHERGGNSVVSDIMAQSLHAISRACPSWWPASSSRSTTADRKAWSAETCIQPEVEMVTPSRTARGSRRRARVRIVHFAATAWVVILSVTAVRPATGATFTGDLHSDNVSLESQLDLGHAGEMAFWENRAVVALGGDVNAPTNDGFALVDITNPARPREISRFMCNSSSFDIAI